MFKIGLFALSVLMGVTRAPINRVVDFTDYLNGYSIVSDFANSSNYDIQFKDNLVTSISGSYSYGGQSGSTALASRTFANTSYTAGSQINLLSVVHAGSSFAGVCTYSTNNGTYSYEGVVNSDSPYTTVFFNRTLYTVTFRTDTPSIQYYLYLNYGDKTISVNGISSFPDDQLYYECNLEVNSTIAQEIEDYDLPYSIGFNLLTSNNDLYNQGYTAGQDAGYNTGYDTGYDNGVNAGYENGFIAGQNSNSSLITLLFAVADTPIYYLKSLFNVEIFGFNVAAVVLGMLTTLAIVWVVKRFI